MADTKVCRTVKTDGIYCADDCPCGTGVDDCGMWPEKGFRECEYDDNGMCIRSRWKSYLRHDECLAADCGDDPAYTLEEIKRREKSRKKLERES